MHKDPSPSTDLGPSSWLDRLESVGRASAQATDLLRDLGVDGIAYSRNGETFSFGELRPELRRAASKPVVSRSADQPHRDELTGLGNRQALQEYISVHGAPSSLIHVDLDGLKRINDRLGQNAGDHVLVRTAERLSELAGPDGFCSRVDGDEFVVLLGPDVEPEAFAARVHEVVDAPVSRRGRTCRVSCSVGVVVNDEVTRSLDDLLRRTDAALQRAKNQGGVRTAHFDAEKEAQRMRSEQLIEAIRLGLKRGEFRPWYQPQFDAETLECIGVEALIRWNHPDRGVLTPWHFLSQAEKGGLIGAMDAVGMRCALADHQGWRAAGLHVPQVSLNVSASRLGDPDLLQAARAAQDPSFDLAIELLEAIYLDDSDDTLDTAIDALRQLGASIELDDFGSGRTSILSLVRLRPTRLKIDRQLVFPILESEPARKLIGAIVDIGRALNIGVTAEGVETDAHVGVLRSLGCTVLQGYALAKPMPAEGIAELLRAKAA